MEQFSGKNIVNFLQELPDDDACKAYLAKYKWHDGFKCPKCGGTQGCMKKDYRYHCYKCSHVESSTAGTLFHKVKFGLHKAFCIVFEMTTTSKGMSSIQMSERYGISQPTAWFFMHKVRTAMASSKQYPLSEIVHVDEFTVGGKETGKQGRSYDSKKKKAIIAVELTSKHQVKRVYIKSIDDYSCKSITPIFEEHISTSAKVMTDKWKGYNPLMKQYDITQKKSIPGKNFKKLHIVIQQVKSWLRTIPTHVDKMHIEKYFNEYSYRINRSQAKQSIWHNTIVRMLNHKPILQNQIIQKLSI